MTVPRRVRLSAVALVLALAALLSLDARRRAADLQPSVGLVELSYANPDFSPPVASTRRVTTIDLSQLGTAGVPDRHMSIRWEGYWHVVREARVEIHGGADDRVRIWLDDELVVDQDVVEGAVVSPRPRSVTAGVHRLRIDYVQIGGGSHLDVRRSLDGGPLEAFPAWDLFPGRPTDEALTRVSRLRAERTAARLAWIATLVLAVLFVAVPGTVGLIRRHGGAWWRRTATTSAVLARQASIVSATAAFAIVGWTAWSRAGGLNPDSLWADDVWVGALTRLDFSSALTVPAPVGPLFVALLWGARRLFLDPEWSLQAVPFAAGLAWPLVLGAVTYGLTRRRAVSLVVVAAGVLSPVGAHYAVFVKQYTLDMLVAACFLGVGVGLLRDRRPWLGRVAAAGVLVLPLSVTSVFVTAPLVHLGVLSGPPGEPWARRLRTALLFDVAMALVYAVWLQPRSTPALRAYWRDDFLPLDAAGARVFLADRAASLPVDTFPAWAFWAWPLALAGVIWLLAGRDRRPLGLWAVFIYAAVLVASALGVQPIGMALESRTVLFLVPVTLLLTGLGLGAVTPFRAGHLVTALLALALVVAAVRSPAPADYFPLNHSSFVARLADRIEPSDALLLNNSAAYLVAHYGPWPSRAVPDPSTQGFGVVMARGRTMTIPYGGESGEAPLTEVEAFLDRESPRRIFLLSTRRGIDAIEALLTGRGYARRLQESSTVSTFLVEFEANPR